MSTLSVEDKERYERMVWLLHSLAYALPTRFLQDESSRKEILKRLDRCAIRLLAYTGCGDLCYDDKKGCICCDYTIVNS